MKDMIIRLTEQDLKNMVAFLDRVAFQGIGEAQVITMLLSKLAKAEPDETVTAEE